MHNYWDNDIDDIKENWVLRKKGGALKVKWVLFRSFLKSAVAWAQKWFFIKVLLFLRSIASAYIFEVCPSKRPDDMTASEAAAWENEKVPFFPHNRFESGPCANSRGGRYAVPFVPIQQKTQSEKPLFFLFCSFFKIFTTLFFLLLLWIKSSHFPGK